LLADTTVLSTEMTINLLWKLLKLKPLSRRDFHGSAHWHSAESALPKREVIVDAPKAPINNSAPHKLPERDELCHFLLMQGDLAAFGDLAGCCLTMSGEAHATTRLPALSVCTVQSKRACPGQRAQYLNKSLEIPAGCWPGALLNSIQTREQRALRRNPSPRKPRKANKKTRQRTGVPCPSVLQQLNPRYECTHVLAIQNQGPLTIMSESPRTSQDDEGDPKSSRVCSPPSGSLSSTMPTLHKSSSIQVTQAVTRLIYQHSLKQCGMSSEVSERKWRFSGVRG
jgi:hypothetical protein